jgi:peptidoglycan/xylan/chitin deacetylase (PgdA/CDA1 family)
MVEMAVRPMPIPVLLYHSISDAPEAAIAPYTVAPAVFERQLDAIRGRRQALTVSRLAECLAGRAELPESPVVITFDDGFADNLTVAAPLLASRALPAAVYVTTGYLDRPGMLTAKQVFELDSTGIEVGAHAHTHIPMDELAIGAAREEIRRSKEVLEEILGHAVASLAYPHGYSTAALRDAVRDAGFFSACGVKNAFSHAGDDRWCIARLTVRADTSMERFADWLSGEGAPLAWPHEALQTRAWRTARRVRRAVTG